jgi:hypothetical protein
MFEDIAIALVDVALSNSNSVASISVWPRVANSQTVFKSALPFV